MTDAATAALCLAGQLRTFVQPWVLDHWRLAVLQPLRPSIFVHVSPEGGGTKGETTTTAQLRRVQERLRPVTMRVFTDEQLLVASNTTEAASKRQTATKKLRHGGLIGTLALRWEACLADIVQTETLRRFRYDWIVRARPDMVFRCSLPPLRLWPPAASAGKVLVQADYLVAAPRALGASLLRLRHRLTDAAASPCGKEVLEHDPCLDTLLHERRIGACELVPRAHLLRWGEAQRPPPRPPPTCVGWEMQPGGACLSADELRLPCEGPRFAGYWRCSDQRTREWRERATQIHRTGNSSRRWWVYR